MAKLKDVAEYAGVSIPTVNQILNGYESRFSKSTCEKVLKAAEALAYRPNIAARSLRFNRSYTVGILYFSGNELYTADFMQSIQEVFLKNHYAPIFLTHADEKEESRNIEICLERRVDGWIVNPVIDENGSPLLIDKYKKLITQNTPVMEIFGENIPGIPHFFVDHKHFSGTLTKRLIERGCKKIGFLTHSLMLKYPPETKKCRNAWGMYEGYTEILKQEGLKEHLFTHPLDNETDTEGCFYWNTINICEKIFQSDLDGIVCVNAEQALALVNYCNAHHINLSKFIIGAMKRRRDRILDRMPVETITFPVKKVGNGVAEAILKEIDKKKIIKTS